VAILRLTVPNETRDLALKNSQIELHHMKVADLAVLLSDRMTLHAMSADGLGTVEELKDRLWSSELTEYRAASLVREAATQIRDGMARAKQERQRARTGRRR